MGTQSRRRPLISILYLQLNPFLQLKGLFQLAGHIPVLLRYRFRLPDPDRFEQQVAYRLPVEGEWTVVNGGITPDTSHSWEIFSQRYAYDFVITDDEGSIIGVSRYLDAGSYQDIEIDLTNEVTVETTLTAVTVLDTDDDETFDADEDNQPYTDVDGEPVTDSEPVPAEDDDEDDADEDDAGDANESNENDTDDDGPVVGGTNDSNETEVTDRDSENTSGEQPPDTEPLQ